MKKIKLSYLLIIICISTSITANAEKIIEKKVHQHTHNHEENREELGIATAPVFLVNDKEWVYGLHVHYVYHLFPNPKWGLGLGYERLFDDHKHNFIGIIGAYNPIEHLGLTLAPGILYEGRTKELGFALHFETVYEFELGSFHLGPTAGVGASSEDMHLSIGLHFAYAF